MNFKGFISLINDKTSNRVLRESWEKIIMLLMPLIPHLANECLEKMGKKPFWPEYNKKLLEDENCTIVVQVNGRKRGIFEMPMNSDNNLVINSS